MRIPIAVALGGALGALARARSVSAALLVSSALLSAIPVLYARARHAVGLSAATKTGEGRL